jgi:hypothetical protein
MRVYQFRHLGIEMARVLFREARNVQKVSTIVKPHSILFINIIYKRELLVDVALAYPCEMRTVQISV